VRYFLAICETLNFTRAAERCHVSQPALTRAIKKLEEELGGPLFLRERNLTHLTELGRVLKPHLQQSIAATRAAMATAQDFQTLDKAPLKLGVMCTIGPSRLIGLMSKIRRDLPGIELTLHDVVPNEVVDRLLAGSLDVALFGLPEDLPERFDRRPLYRERYLVAFPPGHRFEKKNVVRLRDMDNESYLARLNCEYTDYIGGLLAKSKVSLDIRYASEREDWVQSMILSGMGSTFLPEHMSLHPDLPMRLLAEPQVTRQIELVTVSGRRFSPAVKAFLQMAESHNWSD
jgi:DNA-binding transcriptional LysR family regulator